MVNFKQFLAILMILTQTQSIFAMKKRYIYDDNSLVINSDNDESSEHDSNKKRKISKHYKLTYAPGFNKQSTKELAQLFLKEDNNLDSSYVETLLINDADPNICTQLLMRPLHYAAKIGNYKTLEFLLKFGATITAQDSKGLTALHYAALQSCLNHPEKKEIKHTCDYIEIIKLLFKYDAERYKKYKKTQSEDENSKKIEKFIPLHHIKNNEGNLPLQSAITVTVLNKPLIELLIHNDYLSKKDLEDIFIDKSQWKQFLTSALEKKESNEKSLALVTPPQTIDIKNNMGLSAYDMLEQKLKILKSRKNEHDNDLQYVQIEEIINMFDQYSNKK